MKRWITLYLPLFVIIVGGAVLAPFVYLEFKNNQNSIAESNFKRVTESLIDTTNNNITSLINEMNILNTYFDKIYERLAHNAHIHEPSVREIIRTVSDTATFDIQSIAFLKKIETVAELDQHIENANVLYNVSHLVPLEISDQGNVIPFNNSNLPTIFTFLFEPNDIQTLTPSTGLLDIRFLSNPEQYNIQLSETDIFSPTELINIIRADGSIFKLLTLILIKEEWQIALVLEPLTFFTAFIEPSTDIHIILNLYDQDTLLFTNNEANLNHGDLSLTVEQEYAIRSWRFEFYSTKEFDDEFKTSSALTFLIMIIIFTLVFVAIIFFINYTLVKREKAEEEKNSEQIKNARKNEIINRTMHSMMHEIKNSLNFPYAYLQMFTVADLKDDDLKDIKGSLEDVLNIINNVYDYENLILGEYKPSYKTVNLKSYLYNFLKKCKGINMTCYYTVPIEINMINIDTLHFNNIIMNGLNNAVKHTTDKIYLRFSTLNGWLLCEIFNDFDKPLSNTDKLFLPFFMLNRDGTFNSKLWQDTKDNLLTLNEEIYNTIQQIFLKSLDELSEDKLLYKFEEISSNSEQLGRNMKMGLTISRITAKALGGEAGLEYDENLKMVRFWAAINYATIHKEEERPDTAIYMGERVPSSEIVSI